VFILRELWEPFAGRVYSTTRRSGAHVWCDGQETGNNDLRCFETDSSGALGHKAGTRGARIAAGTGLRSIPGWHIVGRVSFGLSQNFIKPV
jgi:hypothetical protein